MIIFALVFSQLFPFIVGTFTFDVDPFRIFLKNALSSLHFVNATVGTWRTAVMIESDHLALCSVNQADIDVAQCILLLRLGMIRPQFLSGVEIQPSERSAHRNQ